MSDKFFLVPLVDSKESANNVSNKLAHLKEFPQKTRHFSMFKRLPSAKYLSEGSKNLLHVYDFQKFKQLTQKSNASRPLIKYILMLFI
jgi:hypothetical protein